MFGSGVDVLRYVFCEKETVVRYSVLKFEKYNRLKSYLKAKRRAWEFAVFL